MSRGGLLALVVVSTLACHCPSVASLSFWDSQFSTSEFAQYRYKNQFTVSIFQHLTKNNTFYITPLVLLDHHSGDLRYNAFTEFWELRFDVIMWDPELQESVMSYLTRVRGVRRPDVKLLPMEKVRFDWRSRSRPLKRSVVMENEFMATHHLPRLLTLTFACNNQSHCAMLNDRVKVNPEALDSLVLDCFMTAQKSARKTITVTMEHLMQSNTFSKLLLLPPDGNYRYLRADDLNNLVQETYSSVRATTIRSSEYVEKYDEANIMDLIKSALKQDEIFSSTLSEAKWRSVFWNPTFARPDRVVHEASRTFKKDAATGRLKVDQEYLRSSENAQKLFSSNRGASASASGWGFSGSYTGASSESRDERSGSSRLQESYSMDELNQRLDQAQLSAEWNGERFVVKPVRLVRINEQSYRSRRQLVSNNMQLTIYQQTISLKVIVTPEHNETSRLAAGASGIRGGSFPTDHSYCLLSNGGSCPPGFTRSYGYMKSIRLDTTSAGMIKKASLGDSAVKCHSPGDSDNCAFTGWEPFKGELHLYVCCR